MRILTLLLLVTNLSIIAQEYGPTNDSLYLGFSRDSIEQLKRPILVIVPFHPDEYMSDIDHKIAEGTSYTYQHTRGFFRKGLDNTLIIAAKEYNNYVSMHADDPVINMDLDFIYRTVGVTVMPYEAPVINQKNTFKQRLANKWLELQGMVGNGPEPGTRIKEGQIVSIPDERELITRARIINPIVFDSLNPKYHGNYYLFINELDILTGSNDNIELQTGNYQRIIKVHYSVYDSTGTELFSLVKKGGFPSYENDLKEIIKQYYLPIGYEIIYSLDSYRFLEAGLVPQKSEDDKKTMGLNLPEMPILRKKQE